MKKQKFYLGKRHLKHEEGKHNGKFVVPSFLRAWFTLRYKLRRWNMILKVAVNGSNGAAMGDNMRITTDHYNKMVTFRRRIAKALMYNLPVTRLQKLLNDIEVYRDEQAQAVTTPMVRKAATKGYYDGMKKINHDDDGPTFERPSHCQTYPGNMTMCLTDQCRVHPK